MRQALPLLIASLIAIPAWAQDGDPPAEAPGAASTVQAATADDLQHVRDAYARFSERVAEMRGELKRIVEHRYDEELGKLRASYNARSTEKEAEEREKRLEAIRQHEEFIAKYPNSPYTAHRIFRLADLYLEETDYEFLVAQQDYRDLEDLFDQGAIASLPEPPGKNYAKAVRLFKRLIDDFPDYEFLDATYYYLGYCYWDELSEQQDDALALATYHEMVERLPSSQYAANGYFQLGEIYFEDLQFEEAIYNYTQVLDLGAKDLFDRALYKLAWAYYRKDDLGNAIPRFVQLIELSDEMLLEEGKESQLKPESIKYLAISLVDQADDADLPPIDRAFAFFGDEGEKRYEYEVLVELDAVLWQQGRYDEEIRSLERIMDRYPNSPDNPDFMHKVMQLHYMKDNPDADAAQDARARLVELFKEGTPWWEANKSNPDALRAATQYIEESLNDVAKLYHATAYRLFNEGGQDAGAEPARSEYLKAAAAYQEYLDRFPFARDAYETQYQIAECYFFAAEYERAIFEYDKLQKWPDTTHKGDVLDALAFSFERLMVDREGDYKGNALALMNVDLPPGTQPESIPDIEMSELRQQFIASVDALDAYQPTHPDMARKLYLTAEMFLYHNRFDEARRRFQMLIDRYPEDQVAAYSAGLLVDSYMVVGNLEKVYELSDRYRQIAMMGTDESYWKDTRLPFFELAKQNSQFVLAQKAGDAGDAESLKRSASLFEEFYREYPESDDAAMAMFNAALQYEKSGDTVNSNRLYEEFLDRFEKDERAPAIFFRIAGQYERTMDLDRAIDYYIKVAKVHPGYEHAADAYWQAAFLSLGLKRYEQAARYYRKYADSFEVDDADEAYWRAAEAYRDGGMPTQALNAYNDYLETYGDKDSNRNMEALIKQVQIYEDQRKSRMVTRTKELLLDQYHRARGEGVQLTKPAVAAAAEAAFPELEARLEEYDKIRVPNTMEQEDLQGALADKEAMAKEIAAEARDFMATYPDFNHIMACMYIQANVLTKYADMIYAWEPPIPREYRGSEDDRFMFLDIIEEQKIELAEPYEVGSIELYEMVLQKAAEMKQNASWVERAREELHKADPNTYPLRKPDRVRYGEAEYEPSPEPVTTPVEETS